MGGGPPHGSKRRVFDLAAAVGLWIHGVLLWIAPRRALWIVC